MDELLRFFKEVLPEESIIPNFFYEAKKVLQDLGLGYTKIDACQKDCILYWHEYKCAKLYPKFGKSRWKLEEHKGKKVAHTFFNQTKASKIVHGKRDSKEDEVAQGGNPLSR